MKYKNYKSAIHNFAHSFQSIDWMKSPTLSINSLIHLNKLNIKPCVTFDFITDSIFPEEAIMDSSKNVLKDYKEWLPNHFKSHNCDIFQIEMLEIELKGDFHNLLPSKHHKRSKSLMISSKTKWKVRNRDVQIIEINQIELISENELKNGFPEFN